MSEPLLIRRSQNINLSNPGSSIPLVVGDKTPVLSGRIMSWQPQLFGLLVDLATETRC